MTSTKQMGSVIGHLSISYDRGITRNKPEDLGLDVQPDESPDGGVIRGLGSKWRSEDARMQTKRFGDEERRIVLAARQTFVRAPFKGTYVLPEKGAGKRWLAQLDPPPMAGVQVSLSEYVLGVVSQTPAEVREWSERVTNQLRRIPLGREKTVSAEAITVLSRLADCPVISDESRSALLALIADAKLDKVERVEFKRKLAKLPISIATSESVTPRRAPKRSRPEPASV